MKAYFLLLRLNLQNALAAFKGGVRKANGKLDISRLVMYPLVALGMLCMLGMIVVFEYTLFGAFQMMGQPEMLSALVLLLSMVSTLFFSVFHMLSALYFNRDTASMAYLPLKSRTVLAAKWTEVYLGEMLLSLALATPALVLYGIHAAPDWTYYLRMVAVLLTVNCIPLSISLLLSSILGHFTSLTKHKEAWVVLGTVLLMVIVLGLEWSIMPRIPEDADAAFFMQMLLGRQALLDTLVSAFPPVLWAVKGMNGDWLLWALYLLVAIGSAVLAVALVGGGYLTTTLRQSEGSRKAKRMRLTEKAFRSHGAFMAIYIREWREIIHVPSYVLNGVLGVLMLPIILFGASMGMASEGMEMMEALEAMQQELSKTDLMLILCALLMFISWLNPLVSTAVSREGERLPIAKFIPVSPKTQLLAKLAVNLTINFVAILLMSVAILIFLGWGYLLPVLGAFVIANLFSFATGCVAMTVDACRPMLQWKSEQQVMKQNMNEMIAMALSMLLAALPIAVVVWMMTIDVNAPMLRVMVGSMTVVVEAALAGLLLCKYGTKRYAELEP